MNLYNSDSQNHNIKEKLIITSSQIIVRITSSEDLILHGISKFLSLLNNMFEKTLDATVYIEIIQKGVLFVFKNWDAFELVHRPFPPNYRDHMVIKNVNFLIDSIMDASQYPNSGVKFTVSSETDPIPKLFPAIHAYYCSIHPAIYVILKEDTIEILFKTYESIRYYVDLIYFALPESARTE